MASAQSWPIQTRYPGIAAETRDVIPHPLERGDDVKHAGVHGTGILFAEFRQVEKSERVQTVVDGYDHHVTAAGQIVAVKRLQLVA